MTTPAAAAAQTTDPADPHGPSAAAAPETGSLHDVDWAVAVERAWAAGSEARRRRDSSDQNSTSLNRTARDRTSRNHTFRAESGESVPLHRAGGRVLGADVIALAPHPAFDSAAMDGWAVRGEGPWRVGAPIAAGSPLPVVPLADREARPVSTGAPLPPGTGAVLRSEFGDVRQTPSGPVLATNAFARPGDPQPREHLREAGEEARRGEIVVPAGSVVDAAVLAAAASLGHDELVLRRRPTAELVLLGDELCLAGRPRPGLVRDALGPALPAALEHAGAEVLGVHRALDSPEATVAALAATRAEIVLTTGGSARGAADFVRSALDALGGRLLVDGVAMRPGHPVKLAELPDGRLVLALPGNPLAAMLAFASLGVPLVAAAGGQRRARPARMLVGADIPNTSSSVRLVPCVQGDEGAIPSRWQGSAMLRGLAEADAVLVVPPGGATAGAVAPALALPW